MNLPDNRPAARLDRFYAAALQMPCDGVHEDRDREAAAPRMMAAIGRIDRHIGGARRWIGPDLKLVVLPEYVLTGPPWGESIPEWTAKAALHPQGPEYAGLAAIAARHSVFLAGISRGSTSSAPSSSTIAASGSSPTGG
jgi:predicted amidohydrolase